MARELHPSGFNQRRIMSAYNPDVNGGTISIGVDLPGGTGSMSNQPFSNDSYGHVSARNAGIPARANLANRSRPQAGMPMPAFRAPDTGPLGIMPAQ